MPFLRNFNNLNKILKESFLFLKNDDKKEYFIKDSSLKLINKMQLNLSSMLIFGLKSDCVKLFHFSKCNLQNCILCKFTLSFSFLNLNNFY